MVRRSRKGVSQLKRRTQQIPAVSALALRGSYARDTPNASSDIDVVVIGRSTSEGRSPCQVGGCLSGQYVSCFSYFLDPVPIKAELRICWQALDCIRLLIGAADIYLDFVTMVRDSLRSTSLDELLHLYSAELKTLRIGPSAAHFRDMKRGPGGQVELEFISVLRRWQTSRGRPPTQSQTNISLALGRYQHHLAMLKEYVRSIAGTDTDSRAILAACSLPAVPWFFSNEVSDELVVEHHDMAMIFLGLVSESRNCDDRQADVN
jgi:Nucleotidyltransferase domain